MEGVDNGSDEEEELATSALDELAAPGVVILQVSVSDKRVTGSLMSFGEGTQEIDEQERLRTEKRVDKT